MDILARIKGAVNLASLAEALGVGQRGRKWHCPFHDDRNPSLSIKGSRYKCFACGARGDAFDMVSRLRGCGFRQAVAYLADFAGMPLHSFADKRGKPSRRTHKPPAPPPPKELPQPAAALPGAASAFRGLVRGLRLTGTTPAGHPACEYLRRRGISLGTACAAGVGYLSPGQYADATRWLLDRAPLGDLQALGLLNDKGNLRLYKHRLVFPLWLGGEAHGLLARNTDWRSDDKDGPKELTIGTPDIPFNCDALTETGGDVFLCEGALDTLSLMELGLRAVGVPGVDGFKRQWVPLFDGFRVVIAFDADQAGRRGAEKIIQLFTAAGRPAPKVLDLPDGVKDVNEWLVKPGDSRGGTRS
jgi:DNA primase